MAVTPDDGELTYSCVLAHTKMRSILREFVKQIEWNSPVAKDVANYFLNLEGEFDSGNFRAWLSEPSISGDADSKRSIISLVYSHLATPEDKIVNTISSFNNYFKNRKLFEVLRSGERDANVIIDCVKSIKDVSVATVPVNRVSNFDVEQILKDELSSSSIIRSSMSIVNSSMPWGGYLRGQVVQVVSPPGCMSGSAKIPLLDGTVKTMEEIHQERLTDFGVYCCDEAGNIKASVAKSCQISKYVDELIEVEIDSDTVLEVTLDHPLQLIDGSFCEAQNLEPGMPLMPMKKGIMTKEHPRFTTFNWWEGYEYTENWKGDIRMTHHLSGDYNLERNPEKYAYLQGMNIIYHHNSIHEDGDKFDKLNNDPNFIVPMNIGDHLNLHRKFYYQNNPDKRAQYKKAYAIAGINGQIKALEYLEENGKYPDHYIQPGQRLSPSTEFTSEYTSNRNLENWKDDNYREKMREVSIKNGKKTSKYLNEDSGNGQKVKRLGVAKYVNYLIVNNIITDEKDLTEYVYNSNRVLHLKDGKAITYAISSRTPKWKSALSYYNTVLEMYNEGKNYNNHTVTKVTKVKLEIPIPMYDLVDVDIYKNYAVMLNDGTFVFSHNTGKTLFLLNEAIENLKNGHSVYMLSLGDMLKIDFITRISSIVTGVDFIEVSINPKKYFTQEVRNLTEGLRVTCIPAGQVDTLGMLDILETYVVPEGDIDVFILDYDANLKRTNESMYLEGGESYDILSSISRPSNTHNRLVMVASQPKIQYWSMVELPLDCANESSRKQAIVDMQISMGRDVTIRNKTAGIFKINKSRRGKSNVKTNFVVTPYGTFEEVSNSEYQKIVTMGEFIE